MTHIIAHSLTIFVGLFCGAVSHAAVRLAPIFGDHMVLQRQQPIPVWGWADAGEAVRVALQASVAQTQADAAGYWRVVLDAQEAGGPYRLLVQGTNTVQLEDVLVGEVWLASGQSNMEWPLALSENGKEAIAQAAHAQIRHIKIPKSTAFSVQMQFAQAPWQASSPQTSGAFTAVGYHFARKLHEALGVPIGIVNATWGGTHIETWLSPAAAKQLAHAQHHPLPASQSDFVAQYQARMRDKVERWQHAPHTPPRNRMDWAQSDWDDRRWPTLQAPGIWEDQGLADLDGVVWLRRSIALTANQAASATQLDLGLVDDCDESFVNGQFIGKTCGWDTPRHYPLPFGVLKAGHNTIAVRVTDTGGGGGLHGEASALQILTPTGRIGLAGAWRAQVESVLTKDSAAPNDAPTLAYNAMIHPLKDFGLRGVIWYQGESNVPRAEEYATSFPLLISDWRSQWGRPEMPFYFVQLASFLPVAKNSLSNSPWAELRDAQRQTLAVPHTGMVVATDIGDANDIHPRNKRAVGLRLARQALKHDYHQLGLVASGPSFQSQRIVGHRVVLTFSDIGSGLASPNADGRLHGFTVADASRRFYPATARIDGQTVVVSHPQVRHPVAVRFGWVDNPQENNLFNREGLPASPFRTDQWPLLTRGKSYYETGK